MRREITIDGNNFNNIEEFYCEMNKLLTQDLTWETGHNLDAFNDLLRGGFGVHEYGEPILLKWINYSKSKENLGYEETVKYYEEILARCHPNSIGHVQKLLKNAKQSKGETLIDIIIEIVLDNDNSGHDCKLELID